MPKIITDEKIYNAAVQAVMARGYAGATTKQIAEAADISEVTLFRKYGNKGELIRQALADMAAKIDLDAALEYTGDVTADLLRVVEKYQGTAEQSGQFIYTILLEIPRHEELAGVMDTPLEMISNIGQLLARYQAEGVLRQEHPLHAVAALIGPLIAANMMRNVGEASPLPALDLDNHVAGFLNGRFLPSLAP